MTEYNGYTVFSGFTPKKEDIDTTKSMYEILINEYDKNKEATNAK